MPTPLRIVPVVTIEHGRRFADALLDGIDEHSTEASEAVDATGIMNFPDDEEARDRYHEIAGEILSRTWWLAQLREPLAAAFVKAATEVLDAERERKPEPTMLRFVELEKFPDGSPLLVNPNRVQSLAPHRESWTVITFASGDSEIVNETPRAVAEMLENATRGDRQQ